MMIFRHDTLGQTNHQFKNSTRQPHSVAHAAAPEWLGSNGHSYGC